MVEPERSPATASGVLKSLQKEVALVLKDWLELLKLKPSSAEALDAAVRLLGRPEDPKSVADALQRLRHQNLEAVRNLQQALRNAFGSVEAEFIRSQREKSTPVRETAPGWRIGKIELEIRREQSRARALYNHEVVVSWKSIAAARDLDNLHATAASFLQKYVIPSDELQDLVWSAYSDAVTRAEPKDGLLPIDTFVRAIRLELLRRELASGRPDKKLTRADFPLAALLFNVDLFRQQQASERPSRQLLFQTGSQREQQKGLGVVLNGLDAKEDYKVYCYVKATTGAGASV